MRYLLLSAAIGNILGKPCELRRTRTKDYDFVNLLLPENAYSDDTVCTFIWVDVMLNYIEMQRQYRKGAKLVFI